LHQFGLHSRGDVIDHAPGVHRTRQLEATVDEQALGVKDHFTSEQLHIRRKARGNEV
jgi:hypothetical protein